MATTLPLVVFTQRTLVADLFSTEFEFYWQKQQKSRFVPLLIQALHAISDIQIAVFQRI